MSSEQETLESSILGSMDNLLNTSTMQEASSEDSDENFILQKSKNVTKRSSRDTIAPRLMELEATVQVLKETSEESLSRVERAQLALDTRMRQIEIDRVARAADRAAARLLLETQTEAENAKRNAEFAEEIRMNQEFNKAQDLA